MTDKIKICFIINNLKQGGAEKQFVQLIKNLSPGKYEISLLLYAVQVKPFFNDILKSSNHIKTTYNKLENNFFIFKIIEALICINRFLKKNKFDLVVSTLFMNNLFVRLAAPAYYKYKIITNMRTSIKNYSKLYVLMEKILIKKSFIVFNSSNTFDKFRKIISHKYHSQIQVIYNGFEIPEHLIANVNIVFGCLGRLNIEKNFLQVVRVFQKFENPTLYTKLIIQGHQGNQYNEIKDNITSKNIELREENPDIGIFFESIRVLIIPSLFEGCPNVLFEALLRRRICIISNGANSDNFIVDGINGFVYDGTDQDLLNTLERVFNILDTETETSIIEAGYNYAAVNFSIDAMVNKYERLFLSIHESQ